MHATPQRRKDVQLYISTKKRVNFSSWLPTSPVVMEVIMDIRTMCIVEASVSVFQFTNNAGRQRPVLSNIRELDDSGLM